MDEYSYDSVIIDPNKEGIESLIGKEVYFSDIPHVCLENANLNDFHYLGILEQIRKDGNAPFKVKGILNTAYWSCIIVKKEEPEPKYVPFESAEEFLEAFDVHTCLNENSKGKAVLYMYGMWVRQKDDFSTHQVISIFFGGVHIGDYADDTTWAELLEEYEFLDGSPCGKEEK